MIHCLMCGKEVDFNDFAQVRKNGNKTGSKGIGYLCGFCTKKLEARD